MTDDEGDDRESLLPAVAEDLDVRMRRPSLDRSVNERLLPLADRLDADLLLQLEHEARTNRLEDGRRAAFLAVLGISEVDVLLGIHVRDRSAADDDRHAVPEEVS